LNLFKKELNLSGLMNDKFAAEGETFRSRDLSLAPKSKSVDKATAAGVTSTNSLDFAKNLSDVAAAEQEQNNESRLNGLRPKPLGGEPSLLYINTVAKKDKDMRLLVGELCEKIDWFDKLNGDYKLYHDSDGG